MSDDHSSPEGRQRLEELSHDIKNHLLVVSMGLDALTAVREDSTEFADMLETIKRDGVESLKQSVAELLDLVRQSRAP